MSDQHSPPRDDLLRASYPAVELRAAEEDGGMPTMVGHFARFGEWAKIDSTEGKFMERIAPGSFRKTLAEARDRIRVLFQHGRDPQIGDKPLGPIAELREDDDGAYYEVPLLDTSYNRDLLPGLRANLYGASFRFSVVKEDYEYKPKRSTYNPEALPERTIREARVLEFGPVTFPAYAGATAGVRSLSNADLDAAVMSPEAHEALPDAGAAAPPHSDVGSRVTHPAPLERKSIVEYITREEKASRATELRQGLARQAIEYPGVLPTEAQATWDTDTVELDQIERDIAAWDNRQARLAEYAKDGAKVERVYQPVASFARKSEADIYDLSAIWNRSRSPEERDQYLRDNAMRSIETSTFPHPSVPQDVAREHVARMVDTIDSRDKELARRILTTNNPLYRRFFNKYVAGLPLTPEEERSPLAVGVTTTGGFAVPVAFDPTIIPTGAYTNINPYRAICRTVQIVGTDSWSGVTAGAVTAAYATEAAVTADSAPTLAQPGGANYDVKRATCLVAYSIEMGQDRPDLASEMARLIQEAKDTLEENQFTVGVGTTCYPLGVLPPHGTASIYTPFHTASVDVCVAADLYTAESNLPIRYRRDAVWMSSRVWIRAMQVLDTSGFLFNGKFYAGGTGPIGNSPSGNTGLALLGYPVYEAPSTDTAITVTNTSAAILFDPKSYIIVDRVGMSVEVIPHLFDGATPSIPYGRRGLYALWRNTARPGVSDAGRIIDIQ